MNRFGLALAIVGMVAFSPLAAFATVTYTYTINVPVKLSRYATPGSTVQVSCYLYAAPGGYLNSNTDANAHVPIQIDNTGSFAGTVPVVVKMNDVPQHSYQCDIEMSVNGQEAIKGTPGSM